MSKVKQVGLSIIKQLGLIFLALIVDATPMRFLILGKDLPLSLEILLVAVYLLLFFLLARTLWKKYQHHLTAGQKEMKIGWKDVGFALLFFLGGRFIAIFGTLLNMYLTGQEMSANDAGIQMLGGLMTLEHPFFAFLFPFTVAVVAPVVEELVFRGFGNVLFFKKPVSWLGAIVTSLMFAIPHINALTELPLYFMMGLLLYAAYARRACLKDAILVHFLNNLLVAIVLLVSLFL